MLSVFLAKETGTESEENFALPLFVYIPIYSTLRGDRNFPEGGTLGSNTSNARESDQ